ncbi:sperm microtubule inner protein 11-like [Antedon mediterranea]|uniref:sperm microtubule inner protein 11-like n=1 Tax=Antedon mediterranea TaxID=105859 RepID=UPI003AF8A588
MSFFNVTALGYQDPIRAQAINPNPEYSYSLVHKIPDNSYVSFRPPTSRLPPINMDQHNKVVQPGDYSEHKGSYVEYTRRLTKHTRTQNAPNDLYRNPLTSAQGHGWWDKKDNIEKREPWTHVPRHRHVNSEMTSFVNEMAITNREFSLF